MRALRVALTSLLLTLGLAACAGDSLETPESIGRHVFPAGQAFDMTLIMKVCRDSCATYEEPECSVEIDGQTITVDVSVAYERVDDVCSERCGNPVLAHCNVGALGAGMYTVKAGGFQDTITVQ